ncbi:MAG: NAD(P)-binding domain-containing protein, partial [Planctomycetes bacterium]|nr:NAD(P)-binding domain-containing protein [Planctomycetota bacterium]
LKNDFVLAMTGYHADFDFIRRVGVNVDPETLKPELDPETMETNVPGMYCAGVIVGGRDSNKIFIENSRIHAKKIVAHALRR